MVEMAEAVGLNILRQGECVSSTNPETNFFGYEDVGAGQGNKAWYVFEKPPVTPASGSVDFRSSPKFKKLQERAALAENQKRELSQRFDIQVTPVYPFVEFKKKS